MNGYYYNDNSVFNWGSDYNIGGFTWGSGRISGIIKAGSPNNAVVFSYGNGELSVRNEYALDVLDAWQSLLDADMDDDERWEAMRQEIKRLRRGLGPAQ